MQQMHQHRYPEGSKPAESSSGPAEKALLRSHSSVSNSLELTSPRYSLERAQWSHGTWPEFSGCLNPPNWWRVHPLTLCIFFSLSALDLNTPNDISLASKSFLSCCWMVVQFTENCNLLTCQLHSSNGKFYEALDLSIKKLLYSSKTRGFFEKNHMCDTVDGGNSVITTRDI